VLVSGKQRSSIPETIVHYFCGNMKGAEISKIFSAIEGYICQEIFVGI
jgi:hypothetical protein